jgi:uncharacterized RmlC-like cupin family protein
VIKITELTEVVASEMNSEKLRVVRASELGGQSAQTANLTRRSGVSKETIGATQIWMGRVTGAPGKDSGAHHHGEAESASYVLSGQTRVYYGDGFREYVDVGPGDFIYIAPFAPHIVRNMSKTEPVEFVTARTTDNIVVNLDIEVNFDDHMATEGTGNEQVRVVRASELNAETAQTSNMPRRSGISKETTGSTRIWMGRATSAPGTVSGAHHHGEAETAVYIL